MSTKHSYFAYGSNMLSKRIIDRLGLVEKLGVGTLKEHQLVFNREGSYLPGGVASVVPRQNSCVVGVIWGISNEQLSVLDEIEDPIAYSRAEVKVQIANGDAIKCVTYISHAQGYFAPSKQYLSYLIQGAEEHNFPIKYIRNLKRRVTFAATPV